MAASCFNVPFCTILSDTLNSMMYRIFIDDTHDGCCCQYQQADSIYFFLFSIENSNGVFEASYEPCTRSTLWRYDDVLAFIIYL